MTAREIQNSGIDDSSTFEATLKNGSIVEFRADLPYSNFFTFHFESNTLWAYKYYDAKGLQNRHIAIKGEDIQSITITRTQAEHSRHKDKADGTMNIVVGIIFLISILSFMSSHCH